MSAELVEEETCPCCPKTAPPEGYFEETSIPGLSKEDMEFDEGKHLALGRPDVIKYLDKDLDHSKEFCAQLATNYGCCSAFRILSDEGCRVVSHVLDAVDKYAVASPRIPKFLKGITFRSRFMNGLGHSPAILKLVSDLAGCELIYHPMRIQQLHTNFKPKDSSASEAASVDSMPPSKKTRTAPKKVDKWHIDTTSMVLVLFCSDPDEYEGGELQYFCGTREDGISLLTKDGELPADRVRNVGRQHKGYGVFMQGSRVFHQVTPVLRGDNRTTMVFSFQPKNVLTLEPISTLDRLYNKTDPFHFLLPDWVRFRAWKVMCRLDLFVKHFGGESAVAITENGCDEVKSPETCVDEAVEVMPAVLSCVAKLKETVRTLRYTADRLYLISTLAECMKELKFHPLLFRPSAPPLTSVPSAESGCDTDFVSSRYGLNNLMAAIMESDNCINDILTIKEKASSMIYF